MGPANFVLYKVAYSAYGEGGSFFVSNMVNLIYVGVGQAVLMYVEMQVREYKTDIYVCVYICVCVCALRGGVRCR